MGPTARTDLLVTAIAPVIWGNTYLLTTLFLPADRPLTVALLRALPTGLILLAFVRKVPWGAWWIKILCLGALNFALFWRQLFIAAYRLPGGVAATLGAVQPLAVIFLARLLLGVKIRLFGIIAAMAGVFGVGLLLLTPSAGLGPIGVLAGFGGALSIAAGAVLAHRWQPPVSPMTFTAWQLTADGALLLPTALWFEPALPSLSLGNVMGFAYLGLVGAGFGCVIWFRCVARLAPSVVASLGFLAR